MNNIDVDVLFSEKFLSFSDRIRELAEERSAVEASIRLTEDTLKMYHRDIASIDKEAAELLADFEQWKGNRLLECGDG